MSDSTQIIDHTSPAIGDLVARVSTGLIGKVIEINFGGKPTQVFVRWNDRTSSAVSVLQLRRL
jgi:hypothetical protein